MQWSLVSVCAAAAVAAINTASAVAVAHSPATFSFLGTDAIIGEEGMVVVAQKDNAGRIFALTNITNSSMCTGDTKLVCCNCVEFLDTGAMLVLRKLTNNAASNTSCKVLFDAFKAAEKYTDLAIDTTMYDLCSKHFKDNIAAFDSWINTGPNNAPISACQKLKACEALAKNATGDVEVVDFYAGCSTGKIVLDIEHESGFSARWGVRMLDESPSAFEKREWSWKIDTRVVPTAANSEASESNYSEWLSCDGSTTDPTLCWPAGNYTAKIVIYNGDISPPHPYATASTVFRLKESFERPFEASAPSSAKSLCTLERQGNKGASNCAMMCVLPPDNKDPNTDKTKCTKPPCLCPAGAFCTPISGAPPPFTGTCVYYP
eukprot:gene8195-22113_t